MKAPSGQGISSTFQFLKVSTMPMYWIKNRSLRRPFWRLPPAMGQACLVWTAGLDPMKTPPVGQGQKGCQGMGGWKWCKDLSMRVECQSCLWLLRFLVATLLEHRLSTIVVMKLQNVIQNISQLCVIMDLYMACCSIIHYSMRICLQARARKDGAEDEVC